METILKILQAILALRITKVNTGILPDNRTDYEKSKDFTADEVLPVKGINIGTLPTNPRIFLLRNQANSGSCVAQSIAKQFEMLDEKNDLAYSATPIYSKRINRPQAGMIGSDALQIAVKQGTALENNIPSQLMSDSQIDGYMWYGTDLVKDKPTNYFIISDQNGKVNFEKLVESILTYKNAIIYVSATISKWTRVPKPHTSDGTLSHGVACGSVINYKGTPYVIIDDSWGVLNKYYNIDLEQELVSLLGEGQRALSKEFIEKHCYFAASFLTFKYEENPTPTNYKFEEILNFGERDKTRKDIEELQNKLKKLGFFPVDIPSTGYFGQITANAVYAFQVRYNVAILQELNLLKGRRVGSKTIAALNKI